MQIPSEINNACYYYIEESNDQYIVFLLCPLEGEQIVSFKNGIETNSTWNIVVEINNNPQEGVLIKNGENKRYVCECMCFDKPKNNGNKEEINIHTYVTKGNMVIPDGITILLPSEGERNVFPEAKSDSGSKIAFNRSYVYVKKSKLTDKISDKNGLTYHPRVLVPIKGYEFCKNKDIVDPNATANAENSFSVIIPLIKNGNKKEETIIDASHLNINSRCYEDSDCIDGAFEAVLILLSDQAALDELTRNKELTVEGDFKTLLENTRNTGNSTTYTNNSSETTTTKPKSKAADVMPAAGIFIDTP